MANPNPDTEHRTPRGADAPPKPLPVVSHVPSHLRLWVIAAIGLVADLWSKHWAFSELPAGPGRVVIPHLVRLQRSLNTGALFGLGQGWTPLFIGASILALVFVVYLFVQSTRDRRSLHVALGLVLAGALGNLHDRAFEIATVFEIQHNAGVESVIGMVVEQEDPWVTIGSYPDGQMPRRFPAESVLSSRQQGVVRDFVKMEPRIGKIQI